MARILIVEDDVDVAAGISGFLERRGHDLDFAYNGRQALTRLSSNVYDVVLLDLNLPAVDGLEICRSLQDDELARIPVIITSARDTVDDVLTGFESGAWDYLAKPFSFAELGARIDVALARVRTAMLPVVSVGEAKLDSESRSIEFRGSGLQLHRTGFEIMRILMSNAPKTVTTERIRELLWGDRAPGSDPLRAHVYKLRTQLRDRFGREMIQTVKGVGYRFDEEQ